MWRTCRNMNSAAIFMTAGLVWLLACPQCSEVPQTEDETGDVAVQAVRWSDTQPAVQSLPKDCRLLVIAERDEDLLAMAAPVAAKLTEGRRTVLLVVTSEETHDETGRIIEQVGKKKALLLRRASNPMKGVSLAFRPQRELTFPDGVLSAGLELAERFWGRSEEIVLAVERDGQAGLLGSALAAHRRVPFLLVPGTETGDNLARSLRRIGAKRVSVVVCGKAGPPDWVHRLPQEVRILHRGDAQAALVATLGPRNLRNVIVVRAPEGSAAVARACWMAPYLSCARKSAIVAVTSRDPVTVEREVAAFVSACKLRPRTVTILADYDAIGVHTPNMAPRPGEYAVETEPCSGAGDGGAAAYGVGRIPFHEAARASMLIGRGLAREQHEVKSAGSVLMVANPRTEYGSLPLAETVARFNVEEFRNFRIPADTYFGVPSDSPEIRKSAGVASLVIYQGHICDQGIFRNPVWLQPENFLEFASPGREAMRLPFLTRVRHSVLDHALMLLDEADFVANYVQHELPDVAGKLLSSQEPPGLNEDLPFEGVGSGVTDGWVVRADPGFGDLPASRPYDAGWVAGSATDNLPPLELSGNALVILQSCSSLLSEATSGAIRAGACGVVGSVTSIHSASGSSFVKAWTDAVLYRGATAGEAVRDARNYFLLLAWLKEARGHKEQGKVLRVAMSFRLWGDPEAVVLPGIKGKPALRPITGKLGGRQVTLHLPARKLPEAKTNKYAVRAFPGSQTAGIVRRLKGKDYRRLMPMYFLRLDRPVGLDMDNWLSLARNGDTGTRAVFSMDQQGRYVYVLYLPDEENRREKITLKFRQ